MLTTFTVRRQFYKLAVSITVDCERRIADVTVTYDRIIKHMHETAFWEVRTPQLAEAWLSRETTSEHGSLMESLEHGYRKGYLHGIAA